MTCEECGKKLPASKLQSHLDFHIAFQLSHQQREEYRKEIKSKIQTQNAQSPAQKTKINKPKASKHQSLTKFLSKPEPAPSGDTKKCPDCGRMVPKNEFIEHVDYHAAKKLQVELNKLDMKTVASNNFSVNNKRKRPGENLSPAPKIKSVSSYFSKC